MFPSKASLSLATAIGKVLLSILCCAIASFDCYSDLVIIGAIGGGSRKVNGFLGETPWSALCFLILMFIQSGRKESPL